MPAGPFRDLAPEARRAPLELQEEQGEQGETKAPEWLRLELERDRRPGDGRWKTSPEQQALKAAGPLDAVRQQELDEQRGLDAQREAAAAEAAGEERVRRREAWVVWDLRRPRSGLRRSEWRRQSYLQADRENSPSDTPVTYASGPYRVTAMAETDGPASDGNRPPVVVCL